MKYIFGSIIVALAVLLSSAQSEAAANFTMIPMLQGSTIAPNLGMSFPNASQMAASNMNPNLFLSTTEQQNSARNIPQQQAQVPNNNNFQTFTDPRTGQTFVLVPIQPQSILPSAGSGPCPDFLGDTFACVKSPPGQPFIFQPITSNFTGGTCPDFLGDVIACVPSPPQVFVPGPIIFNQRPN